MKIAITINWIFCFARGGAGYQPVSPRAFRLLLSSFIVSFFLTPLPSHAQTDSPQKPSASTQSAESQLVISRKSPSLPVFSGNWKINHGLSQSPSPVFAKTEVSLIVTQDEKQLVVEQKLRLNGHDQPSQPLEYHLDQTPHEMHVTRPVAGKAKLTSRWIAKEGRLELRSVIETPLHDEKGEKTEDARLLTLEYWELLDQGKLLKVVRIKEWPDRTETSRLIFERQ